MLDYEEMCIALHLIYRCLDGEPVPLALNAQLVPPHRRGSHASTGSAALSRRDSAQLPPARPRPPSAGPLQSQMADMSIGVYASRAAFIADNLRRPPSVPVGGVQVLPHSVSGSMASSPGHRRLSGVAAGDNEVATAFAPQKSAVPPARPRPPSAGRLSGATVNFGFVSNRLYTCRRLPLSTNGLCRWANMRHSSINLIRTTINSSTAVT
jgi:hypothetical protein